MLCQFFRGIDFTTFNSSFEVVDHAVALLVHFRYIAGALQVHCKCIAGASQVHCRCIAGALQEHCRCIVGALNCIVDALQELIEISINSLARHLGLSSLFNLVPINIENMGM